jgi:hypothetical protein
VSGGVRDLVERVRDLGASLCVHGDKLRVLNPAALDPETVEELRRRKAELLAALCSVLDCGRIGHRVQLGEGKHTILCSPHARELERRVRASFGPAACAECSTPIPGTSSLCARCGAARSRLVAFALQLGATPPPVEEEAGDG